MNGTDRVEGVVLGGPGVHTITAPLQNDTVSSLDEVAIAGGLIGSRMQVEVRQTLEPFTVQ